MLLRRRRCFAPEAILNGLTGFDATPPGKPARVTWTEPENPSWLATEIVMGALAPCGIERELEERAIAKSGEGGGGGCTIADEPPAPPPHPHTRNSREKSLRELRRDAPMAAVGPRSAIACKIL